MGDSTTVASEARAAAYAMPLESMNVAQPALFRDDVHWPYFERLRREDPVHYCPASAFGPYWSITKYHDIVAVDTNHQVFSSAASLGGFVINGRPGDSNFPMLITMDPPQHTQKRRTVTPIVSANNLRLMEPLIRERAGLILDTVPIGEEFDWVDRVAIELTSMTLATLFDVPLEDRRRLIRWSDVYTSWPGFGVVDSVEQQRAELNECAEYFNVLWKERAAAEPQGDLISMLAHGEATRGMSPLEYFGNVILLLVGANDSTRNSISGSVFALNRNPQQYAKLCANHALIPSMVAETIRWQTPVAHVRRTAVADIEFQGKKICAGDKVVMWYVSGNRDADVIDSPDDYIIDRPRPRQHLSFGAGIHRCMGSRLAELQLQVIWEEILKRFQTIELVGEPQRSYSTFVRGYTRLLVRVRHRN